MTREIRFNAFDMNCVGHQSPGLWAHPRDRSWQYKDLEYWVELAEILERGKFDGLFIADVLGVYDVYHGNLDAALRNSTQIPVDDPLQLVPAMALVTKNLGFGLTASLSFEHPYTFARRLSTLDHLTKGRAGWNIVTSYLDSGAKNIGLGGQSAHDDRYDVADEYMEVCYKLWEGSWEDDAVLRDRARRIFTDPAKVHRSDMTAAISRFRACISANLRRNERRCSIKRALRREDAASLASMPSASSSRPHRRPFLRSPSPRSAKASQPPAAIRGASSSSICRP
jgi:FMN-dependent oxidoreductase (nitrilotriacetate monooxygenase family)